MDYVDVDDFEYIFLPRKLIAGQFALLMMMHCSICGSHLKSNVKHGYLYCLSFPNGSLPRAPFSTNPSAVTVLKAIAEEDYLDPLYFSSRATCSGFPFRSS